MDRRERKPTAGSEPPCHARNDPFVKGYVLGEHADRIDQVEPSGPELVAEQIAFDERDGSRGHAIGVVGTSRLSQHRRRSVEAHKLADAGQRPEISARAAAEVEHGDRLTKPPTDTFQPVAQLNARFAAIEL